MCQRGDPRGHQLQHVGLTDQAWLQPRNDQVEIYDPHEQSIGAAQCDLQRRPIGYETTDEDLEDGAGAGPDREMYDRYQHEEIQVLGGERLGAQEDRAVYP